MNEGQARLVNSVIQSVQKGSKIPRILAPGEFSEYHVLIEKLCIGLVEHSILVVTDYEEVRIHLTNKLLNQIQICSSTEFISKKIELNGPISINRFSLIIVDRIPYGNPITLDNGHKVRYTGYLKGLIRYMYWIYKCQIINISKSDINSLLRVNHYIPYDSNPELL